MKSAIESFLGFVGHGPACEIKKSGLACTCGLDAARAEFERLKAVIYATRETRTAQKTYYDKGRLQGDLKKAKQWELELDKRLARLWQKDPSAEAQQERLL